MNGLNELDPARFRKNTLARVCRVAENERRLVLLSGNETDPARAGFVCGRRMISFVRQLNFSLYASIWASVSKA
jgi:hypothetical protein